MINLEFLVVTYFVSLFVDWIFQWEWQASNKSNWGIKDKKVFSKGFMALITHSAIYAIITTVIVSLLIGLSDTESDIMLAVLYVTHILIDSRIPVKNIMKFKGMSDEQINDYTNYGFMHIGIDHRLHELVILVLSIFIK
jgi:hypothetical protein